MDRIVKVFGERKTAARASIQMLDAAEGIRCVGHMGVPDEVLDPFDEKLKRVVAVQKGPWKRIYKEAIKDLRADLLGPVGAWTHSAPTYNSAFRDHGVSVIFMVRNPYSWILSLYRTPKHTMGHCGGTLDEFLTFPWLPVGRDNVKPGVLSSPMELWSLKLRAYRKFRARAKKEEVKSTQVKFEDFAAFPISSLGQALKRLDIPADGLKALSRSQKPLCGIPEERRTYHVREFWQSELTARNVELINAFVDWDLAEIYGYQPMDPADFPDTIASDGEGDPAPATRGGVGVVDDEPGADQLDPVIDRGVA